MGGRKDHLFAYRIKEISQNGELKTTRKLV